MGGTEQNTTANPLAIGASPEEEPEMSLASEALIFAFAGGVPSAAWTAISLANQWPWWVVPAILLACLAMGSAVWATEPPKASG